MIKLGKRLRKLVTDTATHPQPLRYFIARVFVHFPQLFTNFYFERNGYKISFSSSTIAAKLFSDGPFSLVHDEIILRSLIRKGDFFVDVGANIGHLSLAVTSRSQARGFAIEVNPITYNTLQRNLILNKSKVDALNCAVGNADSGLLEIQHSASDDCNSIIIHGGENNNTGTDTNYTVPHKACFAVPARTLDSIASEHNWPNRIRLIKLARSLDPAKAYQTRATEPAVVAIFNPQAIRINALHHLVSNSSEPAVVAILSPRTIRINALHRLVSNLRAQKRSIPTESTFLRHSC